MATVTRNISIPPELDARVRKLSHEEMPTFSKLVTDALTRELDRLDRVRTRPRRKPATTIPKRKTA